MKFYIPFGDWSQDGHCQYEKVLVEAPSMEVLLEAEKKIKEKYGEDFFRGFASQYEDCNLSDSVKQALNENCHCGLDLEDEYDFTLDEIEEFFINLLNAFGANITCVEDYPMICNWTCPGFKTVGYGYFYD